MATQAKGEVKIRGRFSPGTSVKLVSAGSADAYNGDYKGAAAVTTAKTTADGETTFKAAPGRYFAIAQETTWNHVIGEHVDGVRVVDVTVPDPKRELEPHLVAGPEIGPEPPAQAYSPTAIRGQIIEGARGTHDLDPGVPTRVIDPATGMVETFAAPVVGAEIPEKDRTAHDAGQPRQEDHRGEELASSTLTGEAVPPIEQPRAQGDVPDKTPQASSTEQGVEAPALEVERQEDIAGDTPQASATETGTAHPVEPTPKARKPAAKKSRARKRK